MPLLSTVTGTPGSLAFSSASSRLGDDGAGLLAPVPYVDEEPIATILSGNPLVMRSRMRVGGCSSASMPEGAAHSFASCAWPADGQRTRPSPAQDLRQRGLQTLCNESSLFGGFLGCVGSI